MPEVAEVCIICLEHNMKVLILTSGCPCVCVDEEKSTWIQNFES